MKKIEILGRILAVLIVIVMSAMMLTACGETTPKDEKKDTHETEDNSDTEKAANEEINGEIYNTGMFSFVLPDGWTAFPQEDILEKAGGNGTYPIDPAYILVAKTAEDNGVSLPEDYISINGYSLDDIIMDLRAWYTNIEELDIYLPEKLIIDAFSGDSNIVNSRSYQIIAFETRNGQFTVSYPTKVDGETTGLSYDVPEIMSIINSLEVNDDYISDEFNPVGELITGDSEGTNDDSLEDNGDTNGEAITDTEPADSAASDDVEAVGNEAGPEDNDVG